MTGRDEGQDILNPLVMQAAMQLWSIVQALTIEDHLERRLNYPSICVKFPMPPEFGRALAAFLSPNISSPEDICVSNPLVEAFKFALLSDGSILNRSVDEITLGQINEAISFDSLGMSHLLGGVSVDSAKRISGQFMFDFEP